MSAVARLARRGSVKLRTRASRPSRSLRPAAFGEGDLAAIDAGRQRLALIGIGAGGKGTSA